MKGAETTQLYIAPKNSSVTKAIKELKGFSKIILKPKEKKEVRLKVGIKDFQHFDVSKNTWICESGNYEILIGSSSANIHLSARIEVK